MATVDENEKIFALSRFLESAFTPRELREIMRDMGNSDILRLVPPDEHPSFIFELSVALTRKALVTRELFSLMASLAPRRAKEVSALAALFELDIRPVPIAVEQPGKLVKPSSSMGVRGSTFPFVLLSAVLTGLSLALWFAKELRTVVAFALGLVLTTWIQWLSSFFHNSSRQE